MNSTATEGPKAGHRVHILHLEDSSRDAEVIQSRLESAGLLCDFTHVDGREAFERALMNGAYHIILCDYNLPDVDGISALKMARERQPETPVILLSGSLDEEEAVKCLLHGATDYLLKQRLERLPAAVQRALDNADDHRKRRMAEDALRESEERFRQLAEHSSDGFWFVALDPARVLYFSPAVETLLGLKADQIPANLGIWSSAVHPDDEPLVRSTWNACVRGNTPRFELEYRILRRDGSVRWVMDSGTPICNDTGQIVRMSGVVRDITQRRESAEQMLRAQRLESIGTLASGVAHDLNNALAPIMMAVELLRLEYPEEASPCIDIIQSSAKRGADMVKQLLTFAKGAEGERLLIQPRHLFKDIEKLIRSTFPKHILLRTEYAKDTHTVLGDSTQLQQVLLNMCVNARDAMPHGGTLTLRMQNRRIDEVYASSVPDAVPGNYGVWIFEDTGTGISPEIQDRIFEPFFTTKGPEKGTGLGLSTVLGIVKSHGGFVRVYSTVGKGTTFAVYLPAAGAAAGDTAVLTRPGNSFRGHGETILVVDDEAPVREITRSVLTALNFKVLTASDGTAALMQLSERRSELRAIITDCHMPHMNGPDFVRVLNYMIPGAGVIVASGRLSESEEAEFKALGVKALLGKPYTQAQLVEALTKVFKP